jgi:hypothetical protein
MKRYDEKPTKRCDRALQCYIILIGYAGRCLPTASWAG